MSTFDKVKNVITEAAGIESDKITPETYLKEDLFMDSLDTIELLMKMEEEFGIKIPDSISEDINTVSQLVDAIDKIQSGA